MVRAVARDLCLLPFAGLEDLEPRKKLGRTCRQRLSTAAAAVFERVNECFCSCNSLCSAGELSVPRFSAAHDCALKHFERAVRDDPVHQGLLPAEESLETILGSNAVPASSGIE